jgi:putative transposase
MESFFHSLKVERIHDRRYATRDEAHSDVFNYVETFYNDASYCPTSLCN